MTPEKFEISNSHTPARPHCAHYAKDRIKIGSGTKELTRAQKYADRQTHTQTDKRTMQIYTVHALYARSLRSAALRAAPLHYAALNIYIDIYTARHRYSVHRQRTREAVAKNRATVSQSVRQSDGIV